MRINFSLQPQSPYLDLVARSIPTAYRMDGIQILSSVIDESIAKLPSWEPGIPYHRGYGLSELYNKWFASLPEDKKQVERRLLTSREGAFEASLADQFVKVIQTKHSYDLRVPYYENRQQLWSHFMRIPLAFVREDSKLDADGQKLADLFFEEASCEAIMKNPSDAFYFTTAIQTPQLKGWTQRLAVASGGLGCDLPLTWQHVTQEVMTRIGRDAQTVDEICTVAENTAKSLDILEKTTSFATGIQKVCEEKWMTAAKQVAATNGQQAPAFTPWPVVEYIVRRATTDLVLI